MERTKCEYGGFLPLELNPGKEYYHEYEENTMKFNCAKAALAYLLNNLEMTSIHVPYYLCPNVCEELKSHNLSLEYYHIGSDFLPEQFECGVGHAIYLVDYFGVLSEQLDLYIEQSGAQYIFLDNCHSFFRRPIMRENVYNIYSAKKFFGVPDGAYLIASKVLGSPVEYGYADKYAMYLLSCYEHGTNACYDKKKEADDFIANNYGGMSLLARGLLENVDYEKIKKQRSLNYKHYQDEFTKVNELLIRKEAAPYVYPLYVGKRGGEIKQKLVATKIYVPTLWSGGLLAGNGNLFEIELSENAIFLPLDQRYTEHDIKYISGKVKEYYYEAT